jgi:nicotinamidase-related amidase
MALMTLPVRFYGSDSATIALDSSTTAFMLVDCDGEINRVLLKEHIAPALDAARRIGMRVFYFHEDAYGIGGPHDIVRELHGGRHGQELPDSLFERPQWRACLPSYLPAVVPRADEADFPKDSKDGFETTNADYYLKTWGVTTLVAVGFALRSCLYHTCLGARHRNYRVILLRDCTTPPGSGEFPDTLDPNNPEGGWMRFVFLRQFETNIGYTANSHDFVPAVDAAVEAQAILTKGT